MKRLLHESTVSDPEQYGHYGVTFLERMSHASAGWGTNILVHCPMIRSTPCQQEEVPRSSGVGDKSS